ncbi:hypothetical protein BDU57DRAFT_519644 [Ampelomyces quisqualis]|uniref:Uncharacterized protein n=1 Tax=Ampelomyces quisqualis TaxID=50730 RepID=A0A6A5QG91_AMPQU|nr:hypothetical protein BDU57DRAFT_519644 [Ampelomyces quisqualis]
MAQTSTTHQPFEQTLRQESYTNKTDRSFPLAGGVTSKHEHHTSSAVPLSQQTSSTSHPIKSERELGTKEKEVGVRDGHGREGLAGAAAAATAIGVAAPLSQSHQRDVHGQGLETREAAYGGEPSATSSTDPTSTKTQNHHPDALAAATAAAANSSSTHREGVGAQDNTFDSTSRPSVAGSTSTAPADSRYTDPGRPPGGRKLSYRHVPGGFPSPTPDDAKTFLFYRDEVVPEPGVDGPVIYHAPSKRGIQGTHGDAHHSPESGSAAPIAAGVAGGVAGGLASSREPHHGDEVARDTSTAGPHQSDTLNKLDPKVDSDLDGSRTTSGPTMSGPFIEHATNAPLTTGDAPGSGPHELRHTGSLDQPTSRAAENADQHHHGRDAALAGGVGVGAAAGLGYAATNHKDTPKVAGEQLSQQSSPYSSKQLDPRALGSQAKLEEQRFDPQARSESGTHQTVQPVAPVGASSTSSEHHSDVSKEYSTTGPHKSSLLNKLDPRVKNDTATKHERSDATTKHDKHDDHRARDAALIGGGAATAAGVHHSLQRNDTAGAGTALLPEEQTTRGSGAFSSTTTNPTAQTTSTSAPLFSATSSVPGQTSRTSAQQSVHPGDAPHPAATKKYEPYHGPMTTDGSPFYGTVGAPAPIEANRSSGTGTSTTVPVHGSQDSHTSSTLPATQQQDSQHQHGREAALVGAGTATASGLYASQHNHKTEAEPAAASNTVGSTTTDPASKTIRSHESNVANVLDPRVQPDPSKQKGHTTTGPHQSDALSRHEPNVVDKAGHRDQHHFSRNAAIIGGTGATGSEVHEAIDAHGNHRSIQPGASMNEQHYDTSASSARAPNAVPVAGHYDYNNDYTNRNVALGSGAALGAGGLYAASKHGDETSQAPLASNQPLSSSSHAAPLASNQPLGSSAHTAALASSQPLSSNVAPLSQHSTQGSSAAAYPAQGTIAPQNTHSGVAGTSHALHDSVQEPYEKDNYTRDAAVLGTAGAAAVGGAAYVHNQQSDLERERVRLNKEQHDREKEQHKLDKEYSKQAKEQHKHEKEQHKHEKEQHKHDKAVLAAEKQEHKHEREQEKEAHRLEKEREKETGTPEKKHGILGFLHRDKSKKEKTSSADNSPRQSGEVRRSVDNSQHSREHDENNPDSPRWKGKNRLHKDPPKGHPAREALEHHELGAMDSGKREHIATDGPVGDTNATSGAHQSRNNTYGAETLDSALGQNDNELMEPHTGLLMDGGKYGDGHGGTTAHGHHEHAGDVGGAGTTDWEAVKKTDTPY